MYPLSYLLEVQSSSHLLKDASEPTSSSCVVALRQRSHNPLRPLILKLVCDKKSVADSIATPAVDPHGKGLFGIKLPKPYCLS